jgi:hypothetical protein
LSSSIYRTWIFSAHDRRVAGAAFVPGSMKKLTPMKKMPQERALNLVKVNGDQWEYEDSFGNLYGCVRENGRQSWLCFAKTKSAAKNALAESVLFHFLAQ